MHKISTIIVIYNPNILILKKNIQAIYQQVSHIILIDNSNNSIEQFLNLNLSNFTSKISYHFNNNIGGIANAQNIGIEIAKNLKSDFILMLDQDSIPSINMVSILFQNYNTLTDTGINLAAIGSIAINVQTNLPYKPRLRKIFHYDIDNNILNCNELISSGMLIKTTVFEKVGYFDTKLFIDGVDHEWCWRAIGMGYKLAQTKHTSLIHSLGEGDKHILGLRVAISSPFRIYYQYRNYIYLFKKDYIPFYWKFNNLFKYIIKYFYYPLFISYKYFIRINKGIIDGFKL